jgi:DUF4097 and DUF4098 domain-containing protein YvlB
MTRTFLALLASSAVMWPTVAHAQRGDGRTRVDTTFAFTRDGTVSLSAMSGDITVTTWTNNQIRVRARSDAGMRFDAGASRLVIEGSHWGGDGRYEVTVPEGVKVIARTQSGEITVRGTKGPVQAQAQAGNVTIDDARERVEVTTLSGDVLLSRIAGDLDVTTVSGDVVARGAQGRITIGSVSGDVVLRQPVSRAVRVKSTSGSIQFDGALDPAGSYELGSHSGDVQLVIPSSASARISVSTWSGGIESPSFPITLSPGEHGIGASNAKRYTFNVGGGQARVVAESFSGDIIITSSGQGGRR